MHAHEHVTSLEAKLYLSGCRSLTDESLRRTSTLPEHCEQCWTVFDRAARDMAEFHGAEHDVVSPRPPSRWARFVAGFAPDCVIGCIALGILVMLRIWTTDLLAVLGAGSSVASSITTLGVDALIVYAFFRFIVGPLLRPFGLRPRIHLFLLKTYPLTWLILRPFATNHIVRQNADDDLSWRNSDGTAQAMLRMAWSRHGWTALWQLHFLTYIAVSLILTMSICSVAWSNVLGLSVLGSLPLVGALGQRLLHWRLDRSRNIRRCSEDHARDLQLSQFRLVEESGIDCVTLVNRFVSDRRHVVLMTPHQFCSLWLSAAARVTRQRRSPDVIAAYVPRLQGDGDRLRLLGDPYINMEHPAHWQIYESVLLHEPEADGRILFAYQHQEHLRWARLREMIPVTGGRKFPARLTRAIGCRSFYAVVLKRSPTEAAGVVVWMYLDEEFLANEREWNEMQNAADSLTPIVKMCREERVSDESSVWFWGSMEVAGRHNSKRVRATQA